MPPIDSVTQVGSPENSWSYSGVLQEADDAELHDEVVEELLRLGSRSSAALGDVAGSM